MRTIDIHSHWYPQEWLRLFERDGPKEGAALERGADGSYRLRAKHITNAFDERFVVVAERISEMDKRGIDVHALSLTTPMVYWATPALGLALSQAFNGFDRSRNSTIRSRAFLVASQVPAGHSRQVMSPL